MKILQAGIAKSGNFWLYKILQNTIVQSGIEMKSFIQNHPIHPIAQKWELSYEEQANIDVLDIDSYKCFYRISSIFRMPIDDLDKYLAQCTQVWTHSPWNENCQSVIPKFDKVVYIIRDPRDVAISLARFIFTPYMLKYYPHGYANSDDYLANYLDALIKNWVKHVGGYLLYGRNFHVHFVFYERLLYEFVDEYSRLLRYLDIHLDDSAIQYIKQEVDFSMMKDQNPRHVRKGGWGNWLRVFSNAQKTRSAEIAGPMLSLLNYPVDDVVDGKGVLPHLPKQLNTMKIQESIKQIERKTFKEKVRRIYRFLIG